MDFLEDLWLNLWDYLWVTLFFLLWPLLGSLLFLCCEYNCRCRDSAKLRDAVYLAMTSYTGTGCNRITPKTWRGECIAVLNGIMGILALAYFIAIFVTSLS